MEEDPFINKNNQLFKNHIKENDIEKNCQNEYTQYENENKKNIEWYSKENKCSKWYIYGIIFTLCVILTIIILFILLSQH